MNPAFDCPACGGELKACGTVLLYCPRCNQHILRQPRCQCLSPNCNRLALPGRSLCETCERERALKGLASG